MSPYANTNVDVSIRIPKRLNTLKDNGKEAYKKYYTMFDVSPSYLFYCISLKKSIRQYNVILDHKFDGYTERVTSHYKP